MLWGGHRECQRLPVELKELPLGVGFFLFLCWGGFSLLCQNGCVLPVSWPPSFRLAGPRTSGWFSCLLSHHKSVVMTYVWLAPHQGLSVPPPLSSPPVAPFV